MFTYKNPVSNFNRWIRDLLLFIEFNADCHIDKSCYFSVEQKDGFLISSSKNHNIFKLLDLISQIKSNEDKPQ